MSNRSLLLALSIAVSSCSEQRRAAIQPPPEIGWVALLRGEQGQPGEIVRLDASTALRPEPAGDGPLVVLGWGADLASSCPAAPEAAIGGSRLSVPGPCEEALPPPSWTVQIDADGSTAAPASPPPPLTASFLTSCCAVDLESTHDVLVSNGCVKFRCAATVVSRRRCGAELDLSTCGAPSRLAAGLMPNGRMCTLPLTPAPGCSAAAIVADNTTQLACPSCEIETTIVPRSPPPFAAVEAIALYPGAPRRLPAGFDGHVGEAQLVHGYAWDIVTVRNARRLFAVGSADGSGVFDSSILSVCGGVPASARGFTRSTCAPPRSWRPAPSRTASRSSPPTASACGARRSIRAGCASTASMSRAACSPRPAPASRRVRRSSTASGLS